MFELHITEWLNCFIKKAFEKIGATSVTAHFQTCGSTLQIGQARKPVDPAFAGQLNKCCIATMDLCQCEPPNYINLIDRTDLET